MNYKKTTRTEYQFKNGYIVSVEPDDITVQEKDNGTVLFTGTIVEALDLATVLNGVFVDQKIK